MAVHLSHAERSSVQQERGGGGGLQIMYINMDIHLHNIESFLDIGVWSLLLCAHVHCLSCG